VFVFYVFGSIYYVFEGRLRVEVVLMWVKLLWNRWSSGSRLIIVSLVVKSVFMW